MDGVQILSNVSDVKKKMENEKWKYQFAALFSALFKKDNFDQNDDQMSMIQFKKSFQCYDKSVAN